MTYSTADKNLAHIAKLLPPDAFEDWCAAGNDAAAMGLDHNACVIAAWAEVGKSWQRPVAGFKKWIKKDNPTSGDVHVDGMMGADGKKKKPKPYSSDVTVDAVKFETTAQVCKVDQSLGIVFGFAIVCKKGGQDYWDLQNDHIPEDSMLKASSEFMLNSRMAGDMHDADVGDIVFAFPMTTDIAKALDIQTPTTGLLIGYKPWDKAILDKYASGEYTGFSIGGQRIKDEVVAA